MGFDRDIGKGPKPYAVSIFDEPMVVYRDSSGALQCVSDFCPHRAARLSEGQVRETAGISARATSLGYVPNRDQAAVVVAR